MVKHLEVEVGVSVEDVFCGEVRDPIRVKIVVDHLSFSAKAPHRCGQVGLTRLERAEGV